MTTDNSRPYSRLTFTSRVRYSYLVCYLLCIYHDNMSNIRVFPDDMYFHYQQKFSHQYFRHKKMAEFIDNCSFSILNHEFQQLKSEQEVIIRVYTNQRLFVIQYIEPEKSQDKAVLFSRIAGTQEPSLDIMLILLPNKIYRLRFPSENSKNLFRDGITLPSSDSGEGSDD